MLKELKGHRFFFWRRAFVTKFCRNVLPKAADGFPDPERLGTVEALETYIAELHVLPRLGILALFDILNLLPIVLGYFRPMIFMSDVAISRYLHRLESSSFYGLRNAFTAAKALVMLIYYGDPRVEAATGYADDCLIEHTSDKVLL